MVETGIITISFSYQTSTEYITLGTEHLNSDETVSPSSRVRSPEQELNEETHKHNLAWYVPG